MLDSLIAKEDLPVALGAKKTSPAVFTQSFRSAFRPLFEVQEPLSRLSGRKLSQHYSSALLAVARQCNLELSRSVPEDWVDAAVTVMHHSLQLLLKLEQHLSEDPLELWKLQACLLSRCTEKKLVTCTQFSRVTEFSAPLMKHLDSRTDSDKEFLFLKANLIVARANALLQVSGKTQESLEEVYSLLSVKEEEIVWSLGKLQLSSFDHAAIAKLYVNIFRLLFHCGKCQDSLASGDLDIHCTALSTRNRALFFLAKSHPNLQDYYAFAYASVQATYRVAACHHSLKLFSALCAAISDCFRLLQHESYPLFLDKNCCALVEIEVFSLQKLQKYEEGRQALARVIARDSVHSKAVAMQNAKLWLDRARLTQLMGSSPSEDLVEANTWLELAIDTVGVSDEDTEKCTKSLSVELENWLKIAFGMLNASTLESGEVVNSQTLRALYALLQSYQRLGRVQDWSLFAYVQTAVELVLFLVSREAKYHSAALSSLKSLFQGQCERFLSCVYNLTLVLLHRGEKAVAYDFLQDTVQYLQSTTEKCSSVQLCVLDLWSRNLVLSASSVVTAQESLATYITHQLQLTSIHEIPAEQWERLVSINHRLNRTLIESLDAGTESQGLLYGKLHSYLHCAEERVHLAERELANCKRSLVRCQSQPAAAKAYKRQIETTVLYLESQLRTGSRRQLARVILEYIEVVAACPGTFAEETILQRLLGVEFSGNSVDALCQSLEEVTHLDPIPDAFVWKSVLLLERIKHSEQAVPQSLWFSQDSEAHYFPAVQCLQRALEGWAALFQASIDFSPSSTSLFKAKGKPELSQAEVAETIRSLLLCADVCTLLQMHKMAAIAFQFVNKLMKLQTRGSDYDMRKLTIKLRLSLSLYAHGFVSLAADASKLAEVYEVSYNCEESGDKGERECNGLWVETLQAEKLLLASDLLGCLKKCEKVLGKLSAASGKKELMLRAKCCWLKANVYLLLGDFPQALRSCTDGRRALQEPSSLNISLQNLSLLSSIKDNCYLKIKDRESTQPSKTAVYPWSAWAQQHISIELLKLLAEVYLAQGLVTTAGSLYTAGVRLGRVVGSPATVMEFAGRKVALERQMMPDARLDCANIAQERETGGSAAKEFLESASRSLFGYFLPQAKRCFSSSVLYASELIHLSDDSLLVLSPCDLSSLGHFFPMLRLTQTLVTIGDLTSSQDFAEMLEPLRLSDQNFYKIAKAALAPQLQGLNFQSLRSLLCRRQAATMARKKKPRECFQLLVRSLLELGCCEDFLSALSSGRKCCPAFALNPHLMDELASSAVIYSDLLLKHHQDSEAYSILRQISSVIGVRCISAQRQIGYLLGRDPEGEDWARAFHTLKSIGVTYALQSQQKTKSIENVEEFVHTWDKVEKPWSVVGLSIGRGVLSEGLVVTRLTHGRPPLTFTLSAKCRECNDSPCLPDLLEEFARIMRESAQTIASKLAPTRWWQQRESLDSRLDDWLSSTQSQLLGPFACLLLGTLADEEVQRVVEAECKGLEGDGHRCKECGRAWPREMMYYVLSAVATNAIGNEEIKGIIEVSGLSKTLVMKRVRAVRKEVGSRLPPRHPVILILDGSLLYIPWESLPILTSQVTTRLPSFQFLSARSSLPLWKPASAYYVVNPSKDLESTQATFQPFLSGKDQWTGVVASAPLESDMKRSLEDKDLVLYCGHSSGEQYIKGEIVKELSIKAVTLLIGCSSGMLRPIGQYEPQGIAVQYLIGGCPALVANLWDVTDKDIDRFAMELLRRLTEGEELAAAVCASRHVCKLKRLIGAAPVVYGVPMPQCAKSYNP